MTTRIRQRLSQIFQPTVEEGSDSDSADFGPNHERLECNFKSKPYQRMTISERFEHIRKSLEDWSAKERRTSLHGMQGLALNTFGRFTFRPQYGAQDAKEETGHKEDVLSDELRASSDREVRHRPSFKESIISSIRRRSIKSRKSLGSLGKSSEQRKEDDSISPTRSNREPTRPPRIQTPIPSWSLRDPARQQKGETLPLEDYCISLASTRESVNQEIEANVQRVTAPSMGPKEWWTLPRRKREKYYAGIHASQSIKSNSSSTSVLTGKAHPNSPALAEDITESGIGEDCLTKSPPYGSQASETVQFKLSDALTETDSEDDPDLALVRFPRRSTTMPDAEDLNVGFRFQSCTGPPAIRTPRVAADRRLKAPSILDVTRQLTRMAPVSAEKIVEVTYPESYAQPGLGSRTAGLAASEQRDPEPMTFPRSSAELFEATERSLEQRALEREVHKRIFSGTYSGSSASTSTASSLSMTDSMRELDQELHSRSWARTMADLEMEAQRISAEVMRKFEVPREVESTPLAKPASKTVGLENFRKRSPQCGISAFPHSTLPIPKSTADEHRVQKTTPKKLKRRSARQALRSDQWTPIKSDRF